VNISRIRSYNHRLCRVVEHHDGAQISRVEFLERDMGQIWVRDENLVTPDPPYPWCYGNPSIDACIIAGSCRRNPNCGD
jgi:hypothetical protein